MCDTPIISVSGFSPEIHNIYYKTAESDTLRRHRRRTKMVDKEMLMAMSEMMDQKLEEKLEQKFEQKLAPIYARLDKVESELTYVRVVQLENTVIPRLNTIEQSYLDTSKRYLESTEHIEEMSSNIEVLQHSVEKHSDMLNKILA